MKDIFKKLAPKSVRYQRTSLVVYVLLRTLVLLTLVRGLFLRNYETVFFCVLTLVLMFVPSFLEKKLKVELPETLEIIILLFIFAAEILGELNSFYVRVPHWDTALHTINGFLCAAVGFALVDLLNRSDRFSLKLSPLYLAVTAFCFSMTIGVLWEFAEYGADNLLHTDMQKDTVVREIYSVETDPTRSNRVMAYRNIGDVILVYEDGTQEALGVGGYLDIGLRDTMKDLIVNFIGAVVFCSIGYFYAKQGWNDRFMARFVPRRREGDELPAGAPGDGTTE
ncbi:MAG: hypothetical protein Q4C53_06035 [Clostridia bacterium]|nr:hypothetical protein [Clostridia bacterium]